VRFQGVREGRKHARSKTDRGATKELVGELEDGDPPGYGRRRPVLLVVFVATRLAIRKSMADLECKVAIVTGAGSGIGLEMSRRFAERGASVVAADQRGRPRSFSCCPNPYPASATAPS
jgi:short chain dehydrogenase